MTDSVCSCRFCDSRRSRRPLFLYRCESHRLKGIAPEGAELREVFMFRGFELTVDDQAETVGPCAVLVSADVFRVDEWGEIVTESFVREYGSIAAARRAVNRAIKAGWNAQGCRERLPAELA